MSTTADARLGENPVKTDLSGNELIPATDPSTNADVCITPITLRNFSQVGYPLASGSTNGLMTGPQSDKLNALYNQANLLNLFSQLAQQAIPLFIGTPTDGFIEIYQHVLSQPMTFGTMDYRCSSGSTTAQIQINGVNVTGWGVGVTAVAGAATASGANVMSNGDKLGVNFSGTTGGCANVRLTLGGNLTLSP